MLRLQCWHSYTRIPNIIYNFYPKMLTLENPNRLQLSLQYDLCISLSISESDKICICISVLHVCISGFSCITKNWHLRSYAEPNSYQIMSIWHLVTYYTTAKFNHYYLCYRLKLLDELEVLTIVGESQKPDIPDWILVWMCQLKSLQKLSVKGYNITERSLRYVHCLNNLL